jgi:hypothetical protein
MFDWVMLGIVISQVSVSRGPVNVELFLVHLILYPVESHVHCAGTDLAYGSIGDTGGGGVIDLDRCRWLWVTKFFAGGTNRDSFFAVKEGGTDFSFGGTGHDSLDDFGECEDWAIEQGGSIM